MTIPQSASRVSGVRAYYEQNSAWFRWVGRRYQTQAIHRPVWAAGVKDLPTALNYVNACIAAQVRLVATQRRAGRVHIADLGCGFGASVQYLVRACEPSLWAVGVTISATQAQTAQALARGLADRCAFVEADFHALPLSGAMDLVYSIEAFAHAGDPARYFAEAARVLAPGGRLVLCDDFRADRDDFRTDRNAIRRWLALFQAGWHVPHLLSTDGATALARQQGLERVEARDLSPDLRVRNFPDVCLPLFEWAMYRGGRFAQLLGSVIGGWALETLIRRGAVGYRLVVYEKPQ